MRVERPSFAVFAYLSALAVGSVIVLVARGADGEGLFTLWLWLTTLAVGIAILLGVVLLIVRAQPVRTHEIPASVPETRVFVDGRQIDASGVQFHDDPVPLGFVPMNGSLSGTFTGDVAGFIEQLPPARERVTVRFPPRGWRPWAREATFDAEAPTLNTLGIPGERVMMEATFKPCGPITERATSPTPREAFWWAVLLPAEALRAARKVLTFSRRQ